MYGLGGPEDRECPRDECTIVNLFGVDTRVIRVRTATIICKQDKPAATKDVTQR
jgi:hypothetical protein